MNKAALYSQYHALLSNEIIPFWIGHVDREYGGVLSCAQEDGSIISTDKYTWSQARFVWTLSALYNRFDKRPAFLEHARKAIDFLLNHARDGQGRLVYHTTREGTVVEGAISIYADCFLIYGISEYCRANRDEGLLTIASEMFNRVSRRVQEPDFCEVAPYVLPLDRRAHAVSMILTEVAQELSLTTGDPAIAAFANAYASQVMEYFVRPDRQLLVEFLTRDYRELPPHEGTFVMPGHAIESMWFIMHWARRQSNYPVIQRAAQVIRWHLEAGWDPKYGGIFLGIDAEGNTPFLPNSEKKIWWPHTEALYALLLAHELTGEAWCEKWFDLVHDWSITHFTMQESGEWWQRLDRSGKPSADFIALPVKDPFHLPRALILILQLLGHRPS